MEFSGTGLGGDLRDVGGMQTGSRHDGDAIVGGGDQVAKGGDTSRCAVGPARGQNTAGAGLKNIVESAKQIRGVVEGAMEGDFEGTGGLDKFASALDVDGIVIVEDADCDAVEAEVAGGVDGAKHGGVFGVGVNEIALTRANDGKNRDFQFFVDFAKRLHRRGDAARRELRTEFQAISAASFRGKSGIHRFDGDFEKSFERHANLGER